MLIFNLGEKVLHNCILDMSLMIWRIYKKCSKYFNNCFLWIIGFYSNSPNFLNFYEKQVLILHLAKLYSNSEWSIKQNVKLHCI